MKKTTINLEIASPNGRTRQPWPGYAFEHAGIELVVHLDFEYDEDGSGPFAINRNWTVSEPVTGRRFVSGYHQLPTGGRLGNRRKAMTRSQAMAAAAEIIDARGAEPVKAAIATVKKARYRGNA